MNFEAPYMLWGLAGLIVPLAIHLLSKRDQRVVKIGSLQLFEAATVVKARKIAPSDIPLMLLRMLVIAGIAFWLSRPVIDSKTNEDSIARFIDPTLASHPYVNNDILGLPGNYWLQEGLPNTEDNAPDPMDQSPYWLLAKKAAQYPADSIVIITEPLLSRLSEFKPKLPARVNWIVLENGERDAQGYISRYEQDSVRYFTLTGDDMHLFYRDSLAVPSSQSDSLSIIVAAEERSAQDARQLVGYLRLLSSYTGQPAAVGLEERRMDDSRIIWLDEPEGDKIRKGDILFRPNNALEILSEGPNGTFVLNRLPTDEDLERADVAREWINILGLIPQSGDNRYDPRIVAASQLIPEKMQSPASPDKRMESLFYPMLFMIIMLITAERILSYRLQR